MDDIEVLRTYYSRLAITHLKLLKEEMLEKESARFSIPRSLFFISLVNEEIIAYNNLVNILHEKAKKQMEMTISETVEGLFYMFRADKYLQLAEKYLMLEKSQPDAISDASYWETKLKMLNGNKTAFADIYGNFIYVMKLAGGEDWQKKMPNVELCFEFYVESWNEVFDL